MFQHLFPFSYYCFHRWAKAIPFPALPGQPYQLLALDTSTQDLKHVIPMTCLSNIPGSKAFEPGFCDSSAYRQPIVGLLRLHSQVGQVPQYPLHTVILPISLLGEPPVGSYFHSGFEKHTLLYIYILEENRGPYVWFIAPLVSGILCPKKFASL